MEPRHTIVRSVHLCQSYLEISRFCRTRLWLHEQSSPAAAWPLRRRLRSYATASPSRDVTKPPVSDKGTHEVQSSALSSWILQTGLSNEATSSENNSAWDRLRHVDSESLPLEDDAGSGERHQVRLQGYITSRRTGKGINYAQLVDPRLECSIQVIVKNPEGGKSSISELPGHTPVQITGTLVRRSAPKEGPNEPAQRSSHSHGTSNSPNAHKVRDSHVGIVSLLSKIEIHTDAVLPLNNGPIKTLARTGVQLPPELRHLQFRTDEGLRQRIRLRSRISGKIREHMLNNNFDEIETPLLFKSTPEGAREFIVPTRTPGMAYALPQSPQQYKQVLMASGIERYFQFARCFRDEDQRADRQPEFTQLDLEMGFAGSIDVMKTVENLLLSAVWPNIPGLAALPTIASTSSSGTDTSDSQTSSLSFPCLTYQEAMSRYGSDKPDTRLGSEICRIDGWLPPDTKTMVTSLDDPIVEMVKIDMQGCEPADSKNFFSSFLQQASKKASYVRDKSRQPGVAVFNPLEPLHGLAYFGHEGAAKIEEDLKPEPGDLLIVWARDDTPFSGGSTVLGDLRRDLYERATARKLISAHSGFSPLWVIDFPLFSPASASEPGQEGSAGICSTHHPFTAPKDSESLTVESFTNHPLSIVGDHYDLVINGVEVGGGSRRIHNADMQEFILQDVLKVKRVAAFSHLLQALRSCCPPHAGFALGFDRLVAMLTDRPTVRDVIAFPKSADGVDKMVGAPSQLTPQQLATYHLSFVNRKSKAASANKS